MIKKKVKKLFARRSKIAKIGGLFFMACLCLFGKQMTVHAATKIQADFKAPTKVLVSLNSDQSSLRVTWMPVRKTGIYKIYYYDRSKKQYRMLGKTRGNRFDVKGLKKGRSYYFRVKAGRRIGKKEAYGKLSKKATGILPVKGKSTLLNFLHTAIEPVGNTMYIWGGGWNEADTAAGDDAKRIGVNPQWEQFAKKQSSSYDFNTTRYQWGNGLDCSGFVGWTVYNILNTENGNQGYVYGSRKIVSAYGSLGFGTVIDRSKVTKHMPGDIMGTTCSDCGHVYIVLGECSDGSVVLVHSAPPGVKISGTPSKQGKKESQAYQLAQKYMKQYYPEWYKRYPDCSVNQLFLTHYSCMRWDYTGRKVMWDPEGVRNMSAQKVLKLLFEQ